MLKILRYFFLTVLIFLWAMNVFRPIFSWVAFSGAFPDSFRYGDLYRLSNLPGFKEGYDNYNRRCEIPIQKNVDTDLYVIGDSFLEQITYLLPEAVHRFEYAHWNEFRDVTLDTTKRNILVLETVERSVALRFGRINDNFIVHSPPPAMGPGAAAPGAAAPAGESSGELPAGPSVTAGEKAPARPLREVLKEQALKLIMKDFDQRVEDVLLSGDPILKIKEAKAEFNLRVFDRVNENVVLSRDRSALFFKDEALEKNESSAFAPVSGDKLRTAVQYVNETRRKYLAEGFDEVYLAVIPNKVTIMDPEIGTYNRLLEMVCRHPELEAPVIDVYPEFRSAGSPVYLRSDSHWNCHGIAIWINKLSGILNR